MTKIDEQEEEQYEIVEYRIYVEAILRPLRLASLRTAIEVRGVSGRTALEMAIEDFVGQLQHFVVGCDDRKLSKAAVRRARGIEGQLALVAESLLSLPLRRGVLSTTDLHGVWHGFAAAKGWRDSRVPVECLVAMVRGVFSELDEGDVELWTEQALTTELTCPEVHQAIPVSAWPPLSELLGRLPDCVTPAELQEALWQQSFVDNPTHAPDHRNYRRFASLAAQMVAIGVELESDKVELLVQQTLDLDRPWRERRDVLSGILSAASVEDRKAVVRNLDRRFEDHADIDDFEIVCGIAEHIGIEIPREGAIRRCALRRWALDPKRGGALPVARLTDFVDMDQAIGEDVAAGLRARGRVADAALLLARLPRPSCVPLVCVDVCSGDAELERLRQVLAMDEDGIDCVGERGVFGPVEEGAFRLPLALPDIQFCCTDAADLPEGAAARAGVGLAETAAAALAGVARLRGAKLLAVSFWREEAPFWHAPLTLLVLCTEERAELFDLVALRTDPSGLWPEAAKELRALLSVPSMLKITFGDEVLQTCAVTLGLGVAETLKEGDKEPLGPLLDLRALMAKLTSCKVDDPSHTWPHLARRFLGMRLCPEEVGSNWSRRPLRASQLHSAAAECWSQLPVLRAIFAYGLVHPVSAWPYICVLSKVKIITSKSGKAGKGHALGQLAPPGRLALGNEDVEPAAELSPPTRIAELTMDVPEADGLSALPAGGLVEVVEERFGALASVVPLGDHRVEAVRRLPPSWLRVTNSWNCDVWRASLPRVQCAEQPAERGSSGRHRPRSSCEREHVALELLEGLTDPVAAARLLQLTYAAQQ